MSEVAANLFYSDFRDNDFLLSDLLSGPVANGFTMSVRIEGIPRTVNGVLQTVRLGISVGSGTNFSPRVGKTIYFGPGLDFEIPDDGILVTQVTVGYNPDTKTLGTIFGGAYIEDISSATVAGFFYPGLMSKDVSYSGTISVISGDQAPQNPDSGTNTITVPPQITKIEKISDDGTDQEFKVDYKYTISNDDTINDTLHLNMFMSCPQTGVPVEWDSAQLTAINPGDPVGTYTGQATVFFQTNDITPCYTSAVAFQAYAQFTSLMGLTPLASQGTDLISIAFDAPIGFTVQGPSGPVEIQLNQFTLADVTGIYTLVKGQKHDTLINREDGPDLDVMIPNPFGLTAFLGD